MSKKQPARKAPKRRASSATPAPPLTDPHLAALLSFIDGARGDDDGLFAALYGRVLAGADQLMTSQPVTSAFELRRDRPSIYRTVSDLVQAEIPSWTAPADSMDSFEMIEDAWHERNHDAVNADAITEMMPTYIEHATLLGACLMYRMLKGGAR